MSTTHSKKRGGSINIPKSFQVQVTPNLPEDRYNALISLVVLLGFGTLLYWVFWHFFSWRSEGAEEVEYSFKQLSLTYLQPGTGLLTGLLVWMQIMLGSNMDYLRSRAPFLYKFHKVEGVLALLSALAHPALLVLAIGIPQYFKFSFIPKSQLPYLFLGYITLFLLISTVVIALLRNHPRVKGFWYQVHYLNYAVFALMLLHSWKLGSDVQSQFKLLWPLLGLTVFISVLRRFIWPVKTITNT